ncbi:phosphoenolpyruvate--protein phosphotransferase [Acetilactobacillus jinshanensis]|uniref:Phosphoenolpyruvate-protein phosphotransferase n=1 Tax=Acetilactobacillus jinshanensis TaxID=1720083 RepID=A0A4V1ALK1_9LACO|nr:phosphoenolpyruvate--protein phosphotransferase [Acetilactobacillus jinshanensis]QBP17879.1 phosphoenolpyruvate--protein phosphotransferase [Acetilactobacillus jinshanensis]URL60740.1 phosphoenolpyruvate--protein phosphotransferase [uncultured bacterium]
MKRLAGISASNGIAVAKAYKITTPNLSFKKVKITDTDGETQRFIKALKESLHDLKIIKANVLSNLGNQNAHIFQSHIDILTNNKFTDAVKRQIQYDKLNAEWALSTISKNMIQLLIHQNQDQNNHVVKKTVKIKINFIRDVTNRILSHLLGHGLPNLALIHRPVILVTHDLVPSDLAQLNTKYVRGAVADLGGKTAHSAIMARNLKIPAIVGMHTITSMVKNNDVLAVDGSNGTVMINPTPKQIKKYEAGIKKYWSQLKKLKNLKKRPTVSKDGFPLQIAANINNLRDVSSAISIGAEGIGLYRTEFLFMNATHLPTEEEQFRAYRYIVKSMHGKPVTFRTLDIGGDKTLPYMKLPHEHNPFLGYRGIRFCLDHLDIFETQLRALIRASRYGNVSIIFPLVSTIQEFKDAKEIYEEVRHSLVKKGYKIGHIHVGTMIETPAAAMLADKFAKIANPINIGTNDLIQFMMAADRGNSLVANLYLPFDPSVIRMIKYIVDCCHQNNVKACVCGEMAASSVAIPLLLGMGVNELSMSSMSILRSRSLIKNLNAKAMRRLVNKIVKSASSEIDVIRLVHSSIAKLRNRH